VLFRSHRRLLHHPSLSLSLSPPIINYTMSYDYNALVETISTAREQNDLQTAVDTFGELSSHCPMTPLLWMQYASDSGKLLNDLLNNNDGDDDGDDTETAVKQQQQHQEATEVRLQTLELGLGEFPGCAILRLHYLLVLLLPVRMNESHDEIQMTHHDTIIHAFEDALDQVGSGSHRNEGAVVVQIFDLYAEYLVKKRSDHDGAIEVFLRRASTPVKGSNDGISSEFQYFCQQHGINVTPKQLQQMEEGRRHVAQLYHSLVTYEDEVESQMDTDNILATNTMEMDDIPWDTLLSSNLCSYWNGLGTEQTALVFIKYAGACTHYQSPQLDGENDDTTPAAAVDETIQSLALAIYERGVAECPTVQVMWTSYLKYLSYCLAHGKPVSERLQSASTRAMRNCPYSLTLVQQRCKILFILAECGQVVLEPDDLMETVQTALATKFLPHPIQHLELYLTAIRTVKRRLLLVLHENVKASNENKWDDGIDAPGVAEPLSETAEQELQDFCEDLRDMYEAADEYLRKKHSSWGEGRMLLWKDRSMTERLVIVPLLESFEESCKPINDAPEDLKCFEKLLKVHQPTHPDLYSAFIQAILAQPISEPPQVQLRLQRARGLYHKAINNFASKQPKVVSTLNRDIETAKRELCHNLIEFETMFGSDKSLGQASRLIQKKLPSSLTAPSQATVEAPMEIESTTTGHKRKVDDAIYEQTTKKAKPAEDEAPEPLTSAEKTTGWKKKPEVPKVRVGKLNYPAHPYTIRVTNLAEDVEDMDLIDIFRPKCGAIVHAKIIREKSHHHKGSSKGWGLVQFEERDAVEKALELNGIIGIKERLVKVDRSHMPATGIVPPGMHRVKPKGEGTSTKQNEKRKENRLHGESTMERVTSIECTTVGGEKDDEDKSTVVDVKATQQNMAKPSGGILAFKPRGVARQGDRKAPKMMIAVAKTIDT